MGLAKSQGVPSERMASARGLDFEMPIMWHYDEVIQAKSSESSERSVGRQCSQYGPVSSAGAFEVIHETLSGAFQALEEEDEREPCRFSAGFFRFPVVQECAEELKVVRQMYPSEAGFPQRLCDFAAISQPGGPEDAISSWAALHPALHPGEGPSGPPPP